MLIRIMPNGDMKNTAEAAKLLGDRLLKAGISFAVDNVTKQDIRPSIMLELDTAPDMIISIGGDGTYLHTMRHAVNYGIPVLGMNTGNLGFLTQFDLQGIDMAVELIKNKEYTVEDRLLVDAKIYRDNKVIYEDFAVNDFVIHRDGMKMLDLEIHVDESYATSFFGDGLIIATPTGSTAYSLSAGGPVIEPESKVMILTPICPHSISSRPMVISDNRTVKVNMREKKGTEATISADGRDIFQIAAKDEIMVRKSKITAKVVKLYQTDFYKILREKFL